MYILGMDSSQYPRRNLGLMRPVDEVQRIDSESNRTPQGKTGSIWIGIHSRC